MSRTINAVGGTPAVDTVLLGKYRVEEVLGEGGMGVVCKAHHLVLDQPVAIKFLLAEHAANPAIVTRFLREAQSAVKLRGEHVARVIDVGTLEDGAPYMVMEYLDGADLGAIVKHYGAQSPEVCADLLLQACEGMAEAHARGIVHRDVKPSNFFITRRPDGTPLLKILDFGISTGVSAAPMELTRTQSIIGTPAYMAPEQMRSAKTVDQRSDLWSMGVVLYQLLAGYRPFESEIYPELCLKVGMDPPAPLDVDIDPEYRAVVMRCLEKSPDLRYQNVGELAWALVPFATDPHLARGSAERTCRILGVADGQATVKATVSEEMAARGILGSPGPKTPPPITENSRGAAPRRSTSRRMAAQSSGYYEDSGPSGLPLLSQGPIPTENIPIGARASPSSVSAGSGQVSISRSMPSVAPSRRGWVIGSIAMFFIGVGGAWLSQQDWGSDDAAPAQPAAGGELHTTGGTAPTPTAPQPNPPPVPTPTPPTAAEPAKTETPPATEPTTETTPPPSKPDEPKAAKPEEKPKTATTPRRNKKPVRVKKQPPASSGDDIFGSRE